MRELVIGEKEGKKTGYTKERKRGKIDIVKDE